MKTKHDIHMNQMNNIVELRAVPVESFKGLRKLSHCHSFISPYLRGILQLFMNGGTRSHLLSTWLLTFFQVGHVCITFISHISQSHLRIFVTKKIRNHPNVSKCHFEEVDDWSCVFFRKLDRLFTSLISGCPLPLQPHK